MPQPCLPPTSFSIREDDPNFCPMWRDIGRFFQVLLNGARQGKVVAYDCAEGWVRRLRTDASGAIVIAASGDRAEEETLRGEVEVRWGLDRG